MEEVEPVELVAVKMWFKGGDGTATLLVTKASYDDFVGCWMECNAVGCLRAHPDNCSDKPLREFFVDLTCIRLMYGCAPIYSPEDGVTMVNWEK